MEQPTGELSGLNGCMRAPFREVGAATRHLRGMTTGELRKRGKSQLSEVIEAKIRDLDGSSRCDRKLAANVRLVLELLLDTLRGRYAHLSVAAFAELLLAADPFLEPAAGFPDAGLRGLEDAVRKVTDALAEHQREIRAYQGWRSLLSVKG